MNSRKITVSFRGGFENEASVFTIFKKCHVVLVWLSRTSLVAQTVKSSAYNVGYPGFDPRVGKIPLEEEMAAHPYTLGWKIPWMDGGAW